MTLIFAKSGFLEDVPAELQMYKGSCARLSQIVSIIRWIFIMRTNGIYYNKVLIQIPQRCAVTLL